MSPRSNDYDWYRIVRIKKEDQQYYIGFAVKCTCGRPPKPCICKPQLNSNGTETGDICFNRRTYLDGGARRPAPTFDILVKRAIENHTPMIKGREVQDKGRYSHKKILRWKLPENGGTAKRQPTVYPDTKTTKHAKNAKNTTNTTNAKSSRQKGKKKIHISANKIPIFKPTGDVPNVKISRQLFDVFGVFTEVNPIPFPESNRMNDCPFVFSEAGGLFLPEMWKSDFRWNQIASESRSSLWFRNSNRQIEGTTKIDTKNELTNPTNPTNLTNPSSTDCIEPLSPSNPSSPSSPSDCTHKLLEKLQSYIPHLSHGQVVPWIWAKDTKFTGIIVGNK